MVGAVSHMSKEAGIPLLNGHLGMGMLARTGDAAVLRVRALPCDQKDY